MSNLDEKYINNMNINQYINQYMLHCRPALITALPRPGIVTLRLGEKIVRQDQHCSAALQLSACKPSQHVSTQPALTNRFLIICILSGLSPVPIGLALDIEMSCRLQHCSCHSWTALGTPGDCRQSTNWSTIDVRAILLIRPTVQLRRTGQQYTREPFRFSLVLFFLLVCRFWICFIIINLVCSVLLNSS